MTALARGAWPTLDQLLRVQLALLTGALGLSGCWLLLRSLRRDLSSQPGGPLPPTTRVTPVRGSRGEELAGSPLPRKGEGLGEGAPRRARLRSRRRPPWLPLVIVCGFLGQAMLQPNWHDTGDAAESMTPIVVLGLAWIARAALRLGPGARRLFFGLVLAELALYLALWLTWAFGAAWTRDPNAVLASRYGLAHLRGLWGPAAPVGALLLTAGICGSAALLWRSLAAGRPADALPAPVRQEVSGSPVIRR